MQHPDKIVVPLPILTLGPITLFSKMIALSSIVEFDLIITLALI